MATHVPPGLTTTSLRWDVVKVRVCLMPSPTNRATDESNGFNALQPSYTKQGLINDTEAEHLVFLFMRMRSQFSVIQVQRCPRCWSLWQIPRDNAAGLSNLWSYACCVKCLSGPTPRSFSSLTFMLNWSFICQRSILLPVINVTAMYPTLKAIS